MAEAGPPFGRFPVLLTVCAAVTFAALCALGTWQIKRLHWKEGLIAQRAAAMAALPVRMTGAPGEAMPSDFRRVSVRGRYLAGKWVLVGSRFWQHDAGYLVIQPLRTEAGHIVLVDRGWVPEAVAAPTRVPPAPQGVVTVAGVLRARPNRGWFTPDNVPAKGEWFTVDPAAMARHLGLGGAAPWWLAAGRGAEPGPLPVGGQEVQRLPNNHLEYALTWFGLAGVLVIYYVLMLRRRWWLGEDS